jgi:hypothetical protein
MPIFKKLKKPPVGTIAAALPVNNATGLSIDGSKAGNTGFVGFGLDAAILGSIASAGGGNNPVLANIDLYGTNAAGPAAGGANGTFSANLTTLDDGPITSSLFATGPADDTATATGNAVSLDTSAFFYAQSWAEVWISIYSVMFAAPTAPLSLPSLATGRRAAASFALA